ncbi:hypothetical protein L3Q82_011449, partial [Scortum barcoo]
GFREACVQCSAVDWGVSDEGRFYCRSCHNVIERTREVVDPTFTPGSSRISTISRGTRSKRQERGRQWMICEGFQFILRNQINALVGLGVSPHVKDQALCQLWRLYLQKSRQAFTAHPVRSAQFKVRRLDSDSESGPESSAMSATGQTDGRRLETNMSSTVGSNAESSSDWSMCSGSVDATSYLTARLKRTRGLMSMKKTLALIHLALVWSREPLTLSDLLRLVNEGHVPYLNAYEELPEEMKLEGKDALIFRVESVPSHRAVHKEAQALFLFLQLPAFPPISRESLLHPALLSLRYLTDTNLPDTLHPWVCRLMERAGMANETLHTLDASSHPVLPRYDVQTAALIVVTMKLIFGLDDHTEWDLSNEAGDLDDAGNMFNLRRWFRLVQAALNRRQQGRVHDIARKQWKAKKPLYLNKRDKCVTMKKKRIAEQVQICFEKLSCRPAVQRCDPSSFRFCWGDEDGADGPSLHHQRLDGVLTLKEEVLIPSNATYWHPALRPCNPRKCSSHFSEVEPTLPRTFVWLLQLFAFLLDVKPAYVYEEVLKVERRVIGSKTPRPRRTRTRTRKERRGEERGEEERGGGGGEERREREERRGGGERGGERRERGGGGGGGGEERRRRRRGERRREEEEEERRRRRREERGEREEREERGRREERGERGEREREREEREREERRRREEREERGVLSGLLPEPQPAPDRAPDRAPDPAPDRAPDPAPDRAPDPSPGPSTGPSSGPSTGPRPRAPDRAPDPSPGPSTGPSSGPSTGPSSGPSTSGPSSGPSPGPPDPAGPTQLRTQTGPRPSSGPSPDRAPDPAPDQLRTQLRTQHRATGPSSGPSTGPSSGPSPACPPLRRLHAAQPPGGAPQQGPLSGRSECRCSGAPTESSHGQVDRMDGRTVTTMELKSCIEYHDLEAAEALVSMSFWGHRSHKPRPLTPTSDSCDSIHLHPEGGDTPKDLIALSSLCMTPPHSPSFAEASTTAVLTSTSTLNPTSLLACPGPTHLCDSHTCLPPPPSSSSTFPSETSAPQTESSCAAPPSRAMATSVIRHTADRLSVPLPPPATTQPTETSVPPQPETLPEEDGPPPSPECPSAPPTSASSPHSLPLSSSSSSSSSVSSSPVLCQVFPVSSRTGMISAFVQAPVQVQTQAGPKPILPQSPSSFAQPLLVGSVRRATGHRDVRGSPAGRLPVATGPADRHDPGQHQAPPPGPGPCLHADRSKRRRLHSRKPTSPADEIMSAISPAARRPTSRAPT